MQTFTRNASWVAALAVTLLAPMSAFAGYRYVTVDAPDPATLATAVEGVNNNGLASGFYILDAGTPTDPTATIDQGFTVNANGSGFTTLSRAGFLQTSPNGLNDAGDVVGISLQATDAGAVGFRYAGGVYSNIDPNAGGLPAVFSEATGINDAGTVVGFYTNDLPADPSQTPVHGFIDAAGVFTNFDVPAGVGQQTQLLSINASGELAGTYYGLGADAANIHGFLWSAAGGFVYPLAPGAPGSEVRAVNDRGDFVYANVTVDQASPLGYDADSYVVRGGVFIPIAAPGAYTTEVLGLDNADDVTGVFLDNTGVHGFIAEAIPEPASWALMIVGFGMLGAMGRQRRVVV